MKEASVICVDENDKEIGVMPKMEAHEKAVLHRAFSVFIFNSDRLLLMQQRASRKYHSALLWANTCCSHPVPGETTEGAAKRRLREEMGMEAELRYLFKFQYKAPFDNGLTEHEIDHVFLGRSDALPQINKAEVESYAYISIDELKKQMEEAPERFTIWFRIIFRRLIKEYKLDNLIFKK